MKNLLLITVLLGSIEAQELTIEQVSKLRNYNHSMSGKFRHKRALIRMANISKEKSQEITQNETNESVKYSKLRDHNRRLFYSIQTSSYRIKIDALDGSIISKERIK